MDVAPTILRLLDVPIPDDMEGKVVTFGPEETGANE
jgi:hypothetical protein